MSHSPIRLSLTPVIAAVWLVNGLLLKVLNFAPRHREIVARILGDHYADILTTIIGILEILMAVWILSGVRSKVSAWAQIVVVLLMNVLEFLLAPDLLLFGRFNIVLATAFVLAVYLNEFVLRDAQS